jgi:hypothetical protein
MQKLKLDLDTLRVESFETASAMDERGTVQGHATRLADSCGCVRPSQGCSISCPYTYDGNGNTVPDQDEPQSNNCWTVIVW